MVIEDRNGEFVGPQVGPDVFHRIEFGRVGWQFQECDVFRHFERFGLMPSRTIHDQECMCACRNCFRDFLQVQAHCLSIDARKDQARGRAACRAGCAEDVAPFVSRVARRARTGSSASPDAGHCSLLANPCFILEPHFQRFFLCVLRQDFGGYAAKVFLNASCASASALGCSGRTVSLRKPNLAR